MPQLGIDFFYIWASLTSDLDAVVVKLYINCCTIRGRENWCVKAVFPGSVDADEKKVSIVGLTGTTRQTAFYERHRSVHPT